METRIMNWMKSENKFFTIMSNGQRIENQDVVTWCICIIALIVGIAVAA